MGVTAVHAVWEVLRHAFWPGFTVRVQVPLSAGPRSYWIVNLAEGMLEVSRDPAPGPEGSAAYRRVERYGPDATVPPLARPEAPIRVADLLP